MTSANGHRRGRRNRPASLAQETSFRSLLAAGVQRRAGSLSRRGHSRGRSFSEPAAPAPAPAIAYPDTDAVLAPLTDVTNWDQPPGGRPPPLPAAAAPAAPPPAMQPAAAMPVSSMPPVAPPPAPSAAAPDAAPAVNPPAASAMSRPIPAAQTAFQRYPPPPRAPARPPVIEAGTFRIQEGFPSAEELLRDVDAINDPGLEQRTKSGRQQTVDGFLRSLGTPSPAAALQTARAPSTPAAPASPLEFTVDPLDVIADTEELTRSAAAPPLWPATASWLEAPQIRPSGLGGPSHPPSSPTPQARRPWSDFFHFPAGTTFEVDGPLSYNGNGKVLELTSDVLKFELHMPDYEIFGQRIPKADVTIAVTYVQDGPGNIATIGANGQTVQDTNLTIRSGGDRRHIVPSVTIPGVNLSQISVARDGNNEIDLDLTIDGKEWDFDLER